MKGAYYNNLFQYKLLECGVSYVLVADFFN